MWPFKSYNPREFNKYLGKTFITCSGSKYTISPKGRITGKPSIQNAEISMVAALKDENRLTTNAIYSLDPTNPKNRKALEMLILNHGKKPKKGLRLIISFTKESAEELGKHGIYTSIIEKIVE